MDDENNIKPKLSNEEELFNSIFTDNIRKIFSPEKPITKKHKSKVIYNDMVEKFMKQTGK